MHYTQRTSSAFTLIELIVSITIFGMMMISIISVFVFSSQMSTRVELNRNVQENIKSVLEDIAEEVRKGKIYGLGDNSVTGNCSEISNSNTVMTGAKLCLNSGNISYFIGSQNDSGDFVRESNVSQCSDADDRGGKLCRIIKNNGGEIYPLTNNLVAIENIEFRVIGSKMPRVQILLTVRTPHQKGVHPDLVEKSRFTIQTTLSERLIETQ